MLQLEGFEETAEVEPQIENEQPSKSDSQLPQSKISEFFLQKLLRQRKMKILLTL